MRTRAPKQLLVLACRTCALPIVLYFSLLVSPGAYGRNPLKKKPQVDPLADYLARARQWGPESPASPGSLWSPQGEFSALSFDYKARRPGDLIVIQLAESTNSSQAGSVQTSRTLTASSGITELFGGTHSGLQNLFSPSSSQALNGKGQTTLTTSLQSTLSGTIVEVLPNGDMVVEAKHDIHVSNETNTLIVRGIVRPGDIGANNTIVSTQVAHLEVELKGKGVVSDSVRPPIAPVRFLLWLLGF